jgi:hypothetical protein
MKLFLFLRPAHSMKTKAELNKLFNSKVVKVERVFRPLKGIGGKVGIKHSGVVVTTKTGMATLLIFRIP